MSLLIHIMFELDFSNIPDKLASDILDEADEEFCEEYKVKVLHQSKYIILNGYDISMQTKVYEFVHNELENKLYNEYAKEYTNQEIQDLIDNGIIEISPTEE